MNPFRTLRSTRDSRPRLVLATVVLAWVNVVVQPCVMAESLPDDTSCAGTAHLEHAEIVEAQAVHGPGQWSHCGDGDCVTDPGCHSNVATKSTVSAQFAEQDISVFHHWNWPRVDSIGTPVGISVSHAGTAEAISPPPPLIIQYCVYLD